MKLSKVFSSYSAATVVTLLSHCALGVSLTIAIPVLTTAGFPPRNLPDFSRAAVPLSSASDP
jgi:hypothetical protein